MDEYYDDLLDYDFSNYLDGILAIKEEYGTEADRNRQTGMSQEDTEAIQRMNAYNPNNPLATLHRRLTMDEDERARLINVALEDEMQRDYGDTDYYQALTKIGTPAWAKQFLYQPVRQAANLVSGMGDTFVRGVVNVPAFLMRGVGAGSEALLGGQSMFTDGANWLNNLDANYVELSNAFRHYFTGDNVTDLDNIIHGTGTSLGYMTYGGLAGALAKSLGAKSLTGNIIRFLTQEVSEALTEAGNTTSELYAQDKSRGNDAFLAGLYSLAPNAGLDALHGWAEGHAKTWMDNHLFTGATSPLGMLGAAFAKNLIREEIDENLQEPRQQMIEEAAKNTFKSRDMSLGNYLNNLWTETKKAPEHFAQTLPETTASTLLTSLITAPFGVAGGNYLTKKQIDDNNKQIYNGLKAERDNIQAEIDRAYENLRETASDESVTAQMARAANIFQLEQRLKEKEAQMANFWYGTEYDTYNAGVIPTQNQVQADAGQTLFPDADEINQNTTIPMDNLMDSTPADTASAPDTQQVQNIPPIDTDNETQSAPLATVMGADLGTITTPSDNAETIQNNEPDLLADISSVDMFRNGRNIQDDIPQSNIPEDFVDDEPDSNLEDDYSEQYGQSEQYNQLNANSYNEQPNQSDNDDGSRNVGTFVFSPSIGARAKDYAFNVVSRIYDFARNGLSQSYNNRLSRWNGNVIEIRTKRGKLVATYKPYLGGRGLIFSHDFDRQHSARWKQKFERDFMSNVKSYLDGGGLIDERGNLKPDGNEAFRKRWQARIDTDGASFGAFISNELQPEDMDAPNVGTLSVSYQNGEGQEVSKELSVELGTFGDNMPEQQRYYGRYLDIKDEYGNTVARYAPRTSTVRFVNGTETAYMQQSVIGQLRRKAKSLMRSAGFLDADGKLIPDGNEEYRAKRKEAHDIPSSMPNIPQNNQGTITPQETQNIQTGQQQTTQQQGINPLGAQQGNQDTNNLGQQNQQQGINQQQSQQFKGKKAKLGQAVSNVGSRVDTGLGNASQSETYSQATQGGENFFGRAVNFLTGLLGRDSTSTVTDTQDSNTAEQKTRTIIVQGADGKQHTLTATRKDFSDKHKDAKRYHGSYIEFADDNGRIVARWSPYSMQFQMADIQDADILQPQIVNSLNKFRNNYLQDFGYIDEYGRFNPDGNEKFRHKYRARQNTTPEGLAEHPDNLNTQQTQNRKDTRSLIQRVKDTWNERKKYEPTRHKVRRQIYSGLRKFIQGNDIDEIARSLPEYRTLYRSLRESMVKGEAPRSRKRRVYRYLANMAEQYSHVITARINAAAHLAGMSIEDYHKLWNFRIEQTAIKDSRGQVQFNPAGYKKDKNDKDVWHDAETIIHLTQQHNESTILHEFGHIFLKDYQKAA